jgi:hypothetical protein
MARRKASLTKGPAMRKFLLLLLLPLCGCAGSLNPLYDSRDDLLDPKDYLGVWEEGKYRLRAAPLDPEAKERLVEIDVLEDARMGHIRPDRATPPDTGAILIGGLVKVGDQVFLDLTFPPDMFNVLTPELAPTVRMHLVQTHSFSKLSRRKDELILQPLDMKKLGDFLDKNPKLIAHKRVMQRGDSEAFRLTPAWKDAVPKGKTELAMQTGGPSILFTAEAAELRQFLGKHANADIWAKEMTFNRGKQEDFDKRWQQLWDRLKDAEKRRGKDEIPPPKLTR